MSTRHLLVLLFLVPETARADNAVCADATLLASGVAVDDSTLALELPESETSCGVDDVFARWYRFTAPTDDRYLFTTFGSDLDTTLAVFDDCDGDELACNDDPMESLQAEAFVHLVAGQSVRVRVGGWGSARGALIVRADVAAALARPSNDACEDAVPVTLGRGAPGNTFNVTGTDLSSCGAEDVADLWYAFVAPAAGTYEFGLTQQMLASHFVSVHESCGGSELACGFLGTSAELAEGQSVMVRVGTNPTVADQFNLVVGPKPFAPVPPNDTHLGAIPVAAPSSTFGTTRGATKDPLFWGPVCGAFVNATVWYSFVAPADGLYVFDTDGSAMEDTIVAIFDRCDVNGDVVPTLFGCDDDFGTGTHSRLEGFIEAGTSLCLAVGGHYLSEEGEFRLNVSAPPPPPINDECAKGTNLVAGEVTYGANFGVLPVAPVGTCPFGEFALWYRFTAPADGPYKFDVKASRESSPDIAVYPDCDTAEPLVCDTNPMPAVHLDMTAGETVRVRVATDVYWRSLMAVRVSPVREAEPEPVDEDPAVEVVEVEAVEVVEMDEPEVDAEVEADEPDVIEESYEPEPVVESSVENAAEIGSREGQVEGGCGCQGGADPSALVALVWLLILRRRH